MNKNRVIGLVALGAMLFTAARLAVGQDGDKLTNKQIMAKINGPKGIFADVKKGLSQADPDWTAISKESKQIATLTEALHMNVPRKGDQENWDKLTSAYVKSANALADSADKKDLNAAKAAQQKLASTCTGCHKAHK